MHQTKTTVVANKQLTKQIFKLTLFAPAIAHEAKPGQFIHLRCGEDQSFILRRPFSIHQVVGIDTIDILVRNVGRGTAWLAQRQPKDNIDAIGPLGNGFDIDKGIKRALLVGGGIGIAPMIFLARSLFDADIRAYTLLGAITSADLLDAMELKRLTRRVTVTTEDGSRGHKGLVTDLLGREIESAEPEMVYACGPEAMLRNVAGICDRYGVSCQVSLEARMACGIGACLGCAVATADGHVNVCSEGPVFDTRELGWGRG
jgi:dihydroorotate dehydrogenase electron transfer subunit